jgi:hypothetical protein
VKASNQPRFRNRKGYTSQNVLAAVGFDLEFLFVATGFEGSAADMRVLQWAFTNGDFRVPSGRRYLGDLGYANTERFLTPFRGVSYHLQEFRGRAYQNEKQLYNHRHAQLRQVVERAFGVLKKRLTILDKRSFYSFRMQRRIVMAACIIQNGIRRFAADDFFFAEGLEDFEDVGDTEVGHGVDADEVTGGEFIRDQIA